MKKTLFVIIALFIASVPVFADSIELGDFPIGNWLDHNYDAVWEFTSKNIRILSPAGDVHFDFSKATVTDFKVSASVNGPVLSFKCDEAGKSYKLTKPVTNMDLVLEIEKPNKPLYRVEMKKQ